MELGTSLCFSLTLDVGDIFLRKRSKFKMSAQVIIFVGLFMVFCDIASAQISCAQIDFNRTSYSEFQECIGKYHPIFSIKDYASNGEIKPYRATSRYFLSNNFNLYSCVESAMYFAIDTNTTIEAAIFLKSVDGSFLEIVIYDADRKERIDALRSDGTAGWLILKKQMLYTIHKARVIFRLFCLSFSLKLISRQYFQLTDRNNCIYGPEKFNLNRIYTHIKFGH